MKKLIFGAFLFWSASSGAQIESGFLLNPKAIQLSPTRPVFETTSNFREMRSTQVIAAGENIRVIKNSVVGAYLSVRMGKTIQRGTSYEYPIDVVEANVPYPTFATFAKTEFDLDRRLATSRTHCIHSPAYDVFTSNKGQQFNCTTVTPTLCAKLDDLKNHLQSGSFEQISKKIDQCKDALIFLGDAAKGLREYLNTAEYKELAASASKSLYDDRKKIAKEFKIAIFEKETFVPDVINTFKSTEFNQVGNRSEFRKLGESLDSIKKLTMGCSALESATDKVNTAVLPDSAIDAKPTATKPKTIN